MNMRGENPPKTKFKMKGKCQHSYRIGEATCRIYAYNLSIYELNVLLKIWWKINIQKQKYKALQKSERFLVFEGERRLL